MRGDLAWIWKSAVASLQAAAWMVGTVWLGGAGIVRLVRFARILRSLRASHLVCPRGHESAAYGIFECTSASPSHLMEGWVFSRCDVCGLSAGWTPCQSCGLPIRNPLGRI